MDDDKYWFNISEISEVIKLERHPYTGKLWSDTTIHGVPLIKYIQDHPIDQVHLMHQMDLATDEPTIRVDDQNVSRLIEYYPNVTPEICQVYIGHMTCRIHLLESINYPVGDNITFSSFVENLIGHLTSFPPENRGAILAQVYQAFEICQIYIDEN
jgi:hypothetical protein